MTPYLVWNQASLALSIQFSTSCTQAGSSSLQPSPTSPSHAQNAHGELTLRIACRLHSLLPQLSVSVDLSSWGTLLQDFAWWSSAAKPYVTTCPVKNLLLLPHMPQHKLLFFFSLLIRGINSSIPVPLWLPLPTSCYLLPQQPHTSGNCHENQFQIFFLEHIRTVFTHCRAYILTFSSDRFFRFTHILSFSTPYALVVTS